jgi:hypothetical protein
VVVTSKLKNVAAEYVRSGSRIVLRFRKGLPFGVIEWEPWQFNGSKPDEVHVADQTIDVKKLGIYFVEGTVEVDPISERVTIRTVNPDTGEPLSFDPIPVLASLSGKEIRLVLTPMASVSIIEELHRKAIEDELGAK